MALVTELDERYVRVQARVRDRVAAVPIWFWLATLVLVSAAVRLELALNDPAPWIFSDELLYSRARQVECRGTIRAARRSGGPLEPRSVYPL